MPPRRTVFQTSLMSALVDGVFDGDLAVDELLTHGDFGLGTFNALDGEMLILDGLCWQLRADGTVAEAAPDALTPFAVATHFEPDTVISLTGADSPTGTLSRTEVIAAINATVSSQNYLFAVRVRGHFSEVVTRTVRKQPRPYRGLREAAAEESIVTFTDLDGTVAGFRTPLYERGIGVPGGHVHFIDDAHTRGGHVLDFSLTAGVVEICRGTDLQLRLPLTDTFGAADLDPDDLDEQVRGAESPS